MNRVYRTPKGTELPLLNLKGKEYLQVAHRLVWFREEHPDWRIETEFVETSVDFALAKATIRDADGNVMATAHKYEDRKGFGDFREKAETGSVGRALAYVGFGTQFCADELDEGSRIVDAPNAQPSETTPGDYEIPMGKKMKGKKLKDVPNDELISFIDWLERAAIKEHGPNRKLDGLALEFANAVEKWLRWQERGAEQ
jgi:hypothetical protein